MRTALPYFALLATLLCTGDLAAQSGPWSRETGGVYLRLYSYALRFDEHYTTSGDLDPNLTIGFYQVALYGEYGITDRLDVVANLPVFARNTINNQVSGTTGEVLAPGDAINGLGDAELGLRYTLTRPGARWPLAFGLTAGLPLGRTGEGPNGVLQTGDGEFNQLAYVSAGTSFRLGNLNAYWQVNMGYNNRTNGFSDEWRAGTELGVTTANGRWGLAGRLRSVQSLANGTATATAAEAVSLFGNNAEFVAVGAEIRAGLTERLGLSAGIDGAVSGSLIAAGASWSVGVSYQ